MLFLVSASSGAGKTSLVTGVVQRLAGSYSFERVVTYTTKQPRPGEKPGIDYHFISLEEFEQKRDSGFFLEWSGAYGHYYGTPRQVLDDVRSGKGRIVIVDLAGAKRIYEQYPQSVLIWILAPSLEVLRDRLVKRGDMTTEQIEKRLELAHREMMQQDSKDFYHYYIENDDFNAALSLFEEIILKYLG